MTSFWCCSKNVTVSPTSWTKLSDFNSLRVILATKTSDRIGTLILSRLARGMFGVRFSPPPNLLSCGANVPQDFGPPRLSQSEFPHAHDRGPLASSDHASRREWLRQVYPAPLDLLRPAR